MPALLCCRRPDCGKCTHIIESHWEHLLVVNSMALTYAAYDVPGGSSDMGRLLRTLFDQEQKMCDKDHGGCGTAYVSGDVLFPAFKCCAAALESLFLFVHIPWCLWGVMFSVVAGSGRWSVLLHSGCAVPSLNALPAMPWMLRL
jgi:hypothetical protein